MVGILLLWLVSFLFLQEGPPWERSWRRTQPWKSHKRGNARGSMSTTKRGRIPALPKVAMPAVGLQKSHRILGYASPKVSQEA